MRACNCGETLSTSVQKKAAETNAATNARPWFLERANLFIALRACVLDAYYARNFCKIGLPACQGEQPSRLPSNLEASGELIAPRLPNAYSGLRIRR